MARSDRLRTWGIIWAALLLAAVGWAKDDATVYPLWPGVPPGSEGKTGAEKVRVTDEGEHVVSQVHRPSLTVYLPVADKATGAAIVICPGGSHRELWMDHEGYNVARWLAAHGVAGVILKYRLAAEEGSTYRVERESLADAQRALQFTKAHAAEWGLDPARVGIMGFSAGGQLAGLAAIQTRPANPAAADAVERESSRPAFQVLVYPGWAETLVPPKGAPPVLLLSGGADGLVKPERVVELYERFQHVGVPAELHLFVGAGHGFGLRARNRGTAAGWPERLIEWLAASGWLDAKSKP